MKVTMKHFLAFVTVQYGEYESVDHALVTAKTEEEAENILETIIKADNLRSNGLVDETRFSYFGHGTFEVAVHERFSIKRIKLSEAAVLNKVGKIQYANSAYPPAQHAIKGAH